MKKISKLLYILAASALVFAACQPVEEYQPGEPEVSGCYGVYFPTQEAAGSHTLDPTADKVLTLKAVRTNSAGDITVPVKFTSNVDGIFQAESITFAAGQTETEFDVTFPNIAAGVESSFSITIEDPQYASKYNDGAISIDCSILCVQWQYFLNPKTGEKAKFTFKEDWNGLTHTGYVKYYDVDGVRTCVTETDPYVDEEGTYEGFFATGSEFELTFKWYTKNNNSDDQNFVELPVTDVGVHSSYGAMVQAFDYYAYWTVLNPQAALAGMNWLQFAQKYSDDYPLGYYENGGFYFYLMYYYMMGIGGWSVEDYTISLEAEGFTRVDYSLELDTDYTQDGVLPVYFETGKDVASIKLAGFEGELTAAQAGNKAAEIEDGTAESVEISTADFVENEDGLFEGATGLSFETTGTYTVVAVAYDATGKVQATDFFSAYYVSEGDTEANSVQVSVATEAIPARYQLSGSFKDQNAFGYYIYGKDLEDLHLAIVETAKYNKTPEAYNSTIKAKEEYQASESVLATINAPGGYETLATGLTAGTDYTVVVWATNGILDTFVTASYKTAENPEVWKSLGKATYTDDIVSGMYGKSATETLDPVSYEVEVQESQDRPGVYRLVNPYGEAYPYNEPGDWDDSKDYYLEIDASDPKAVYYDLQDLGLDWGDGAMFSISYAGYNYLNGKTKEEIAAAGLFGKLEKGVITFPEKGLLVGFDGNNNLYYGNTRSAFKIVLPSAADAQKSSVVSAPVAVDKASFSGKTSGLEQNVVSFQHESQNVTIKTSKIAPRETLKVVDRNQIQRKVSKDTIL